MPAYADGAATYNTPVRHSFGLDDFIRRHAQHFDRTAYACAISVFGRWWVVTSSYTTPELWKPSEAPPTTAMCRRRQHKGGFSCVTSTSTLCQEMPRFAATLRHSPSWKVNHPPFFIGLGPSSGRSAAWCCVPGAMCFPVFVVEYLNVHPFSLICTLCSHSQVFSMPINRACCWLVTNDVMLTGAQRPPVPRSGRCMSRVISKRMWNANLSELNARPRYACGLTGNFQSMSHKPAYCAFAWEAANLSRIPSHASIVYTYPADHGIYSSSIDCSLFSSLAKSVKPSS